MTLEQLRIFVAVALREHVTRGARDLNLTQSATSAAITALETRYGTKLFDRVGRRIELTEAGRIFLKEAKAVLAQAAVAERTLTDLTDMTRGTLVLAASQTIGNYWLPSLIHSFRSQYPGVLINMLMGNTEGVASQVHEGIADLGFVEGKIDNSALSILPVADDEMAIVASPSHRWVKELPQSLEELKVGPWVLREPGSGTRSIFAAELLTMGLSIQGLSIALELPSNEAVRMAVEAGAGVTVISKLVVASSVKAGELVLIPFPLPNRRFYVLRHKERYVTQAQRVFLKMITDMSNTPPLPKRSDWG